VPRSQSADDFGKKLSELLILHREKLGVSKLALAQKSGLDQRTITFIERGTNSPSVKTLFLLCKALELDMARIISEVLSSD